MAGPIDAITAIHNAFRKDMDSIDDAALATARGTPGLEATVERFRFLNEILVWHANGEEIAVFPAVEKVAPLVTEPYEEDHRGLDAAFEALDDAVSAGDTLASARAAAAFKFHLDLHLTKEDTHLYRIFGERVAAPDQAKAIGVVAAQVPQDRQPELIAWWFPLIGNDDGENMLRIYQMMLPPEALTGVHRLVRQAVGEDWAELVQRIPDLAV